MGLVIAASACNERAHISHQGITSWYCLVGALAEKTFQTQKTSHMVM